MGVIQTDVGVRTHSEENISLQNVLGNHPVPFLAREIEIQKKNILNCLINSQGKVLLDEEPTDVEQINRIVKKKLSQNPLLIVSVKAHPKTAYSDYVRVIDQLKIANAKKISIANSN